MKIFSTIMWTLLVISVTAFAVGFIYSPVLAAFGFIGAMIFGLIVWACFAIKRCPPL